jgi:hypothetical protein
VDRVEIDALEHGAAIALEAAGEVADSRRAARAYQDPPTEMSGGRPQFSVPPPGT